MKKIISSILVLLLLLTLPISANAATLVGMKPTIEVYKYNETTKRYDIPAETVEKGELLYVRVALQRMAPSIATLRLRLEFEKDKVSYVGGYFTPEIISNVQSEDMVFTKKDNSIVAFFARKNLTNGAEIATDVTGIASFVFSCDVSEGDLNFKATIDNALDKDYNDVLMTEQSCEAHIKVQKWRMPDAHRLIFEKLRGEMVYAPETAEDSKADIDAADNIFNGYTSAEKLKFQSTESELYQFYATAWTRYYDASIEASEKLLQAEVDRFVEENKIALSITNPEDVTINNYQEILDAITAYGKLTAKAQVLALKEKARLDKLETAAETIEAQVEEDQFAQTYFIDDYENVLWNLTPDDISEDNYGQFEGSVLGAVALYNDLDHDSMSSEMKEKVNSYYSKLTKLYDRIKEIVQNIEGEEEILKEIEVFTSKWHSVTRLTPLTVGVKDKTAIELMLQDYEKLSEIAKKRLESRKNMAEQLLALVGGYNEIQNSTGNGGNSVVVPSGGTTQTIVKEVPVEVLETQTFRNQVIRNVPNIVYIIILLMGIAMVTVPIPIITYWLYRRNKKKKGEVEDV